jgi:hypothetical protein
MGRLPCGLDQLAEPQVRADTTKVLKTPDVGRPRQGELCRCQRIKSRPLPARDFLAQFHGEDLPLAGLAGDVPSPSLITRTRGNRCHGFGRRFRSTQVQSVAGTIKIVFSTACVTNIIPMPSSRCSRRGRISTCTLAIPPIGLTAQR